MVVFGRLCRGVAALAAVMASTSKFKTCLLLIAYFVGITQHAQASVGGVAEYDIYICIFFHTNMYTIRVYSRTYMNAR